jgi:oligoribonuclease (3'-5' exoribonuclease)
MSEEPTDNDLIIYNEISEMRQHNFSTGTSLTKFKVLIELIKKNPQWQQIITDEHEDCLTRFIRELDDTKKEALEVLEEFKLRSHHYENVTQQRRNTQMEQEQAYQNFLGIVNDITKRSPTATITEIWQQVGHIHNARRFMRRRLDELLIDTKELTK